MHGGNQNTPSLHQRLIGELRADKKRAAILGIALLVAVIVGGRLLLKSSGPERAKAATPRAAAGQSPAPQAGATFVPPHLADQERGSRLQNWKSRRSPDGKVTRDLFAAKLEFYTLVAPEPVKKAPASRPVGPDPLEIQRAVRAEAKTLSLQSTMIGPDPSAMIGGRILRVGEWISGFRIMAIHRRSCVVEKNDVKVTLEMKK